jgi:hypothetical protein
MSKKPWGRFFKIWHWSVAQSSSAAWPKLGRSVIETFFYILRKQASLGPKQSFIYEPASGDYNASVVAR